MRPFSVYLDSSRRFPVQHLSRCPSISEVFLSDGNEETFACCRVHILLAEYAENKCQFTLSLTVATLI